MKSLMKFLTVALLAIVIVAPASSEVRFGIKAGMAMNKLSLSKNLSDNFNSENQTGFTGGIMTEFTLPVVGLCFDASVLYAHRSGKITGSENVTFKRNYIDIPVNLKYKLSFFGSGNVFAPFVTTGPDFAIMFKDNAETGDGTKNTSFTTAWNFGFGVELLKHVQIAASYSLGLNKTLEKVIGSGLSTQTLDGKDKCWTITAAYLF